MAILLLIKNPNEGFTYINDMVGVYNDTHQFSATELEHFNFLTINGSRHDVDLLLKQIQPEILFAYWTGSEWSLQMPDEIDPVVEDIRVYRVESGKRWYKLVNPFKFLINIGDLSVEEKTLLETYDINHPSVGSFVRKVLKDITSDSANNEEIKKLRNVNP